MSALRGQRVLITRSAEDCGAWAQCLERAGAVPVILPCIACETIHDPGTRTRLALALPEADWLVFTSRRGVRAFSGVRKQLRLPPDMGADARVAVVGPATAEAAHVSLGRVDLVAEGGTARSLARELAVLLRREDAQGTARVVLALAENADTALEDTLEAAGAACTRLDVYRTVPADPRTEKQPLSTLGVDKILLASPSAVTGLLNQIELDTAAEIFTIGPATTRVARAAALRVAGEAARPSLEGMMETMG